MKPQIQYTKSGNISIAYQVFGSGPVDLIYIPGWVSNIDWMWACPELVHFFEELGKIARVLIFDKRGTGLSDRVVEQSTLEERMQDITAVMDATGSKKAILFGHSEGGSVSALYSATYPNRVISLITFGVFAKRKYSKNYPWAPSDQERQELYATIQNHWGSGKMNLENLAPSKAQDIKFMNWLASYFRLGASPQAALKLTKMNTEINITGILKYIKVPTLLMQRTNDIDVNIEEGKFINKRIKNSKFVEFDGDDHLFWAGNTQEVLDEIKKFIKNTKPPQKVLPRLFSVLYGKLLSSTINSGDNYKIISEFISSHEGVIIQQPKENYFIARFKTPGSAVNCSIALQEALKKINTNAAFGIAMQEVTNEGDVLISERDNYALNSIRSQLKLSKVLVAPTVKHLLAGAELNFTTESAILDITALDICKLYSVTRMSNSLTEKQEEAPLGLSTYDSFLENVLSVIDSHLDDDTFSIEILSKKMVLSERQLQRKIKEFTGKSPNQLITAIRLKRAKAALQTNIYTVAEIAFRYGFSCPSYFSKCFKKEFGLQPRALLSRA